ncbi:hypothetical protein SOVF_075220 isoform A [Spinacia oleracea]|nr:hypothetical protein SOVF_075220 isoform A [Spinacia oleracea]
MLGYLGRFVSIQISENKPMEIRQTCRRRRVFHLEV